MLLQIWNNKLQSNNYTIKRKPQIVKDWFSSHCSLKKLLFFKWKWKKIYYLLLGVFEFFKVQKDSWIYIVPFSCKTMFVHGLVCRLPFWKIRVVNCLSMDEGNCREKGTKTYKIPLEDSCGAVWWSKVFFLRSYIYLIFYFHNFFKNIMK